MTRLLVLALIAAVALGCKKEDKKAFTPAAKGGPEGPAAPPAESKNTNYVAGGGAVQNVRNAVRRTVELANMHALGVFVTAMDLENGKMPGKDEILTALKADPSQKPLLDMIEDGTIKLTGTKNRTALWAYEVDSETKGGCALVGPTASRKTADEIKTLLQGV